LKRYRDQEDPDAEQFRTVMKSVTATVDSASEMKRLQTQLTSASEDKASVGRATLHIGQGKSNIDLAAEDALLDVTKPDGRGNKRNLQVIRHKANGIHSRLFNYIAFREKASITQKP
jgi:hypothetical protein